MKPIDSIWTFPDLTVLKNCFLPLHKVYRYYADHPLIWADICIEYLYAYFPQRIYRSLVYNVKSNDPDIRKRYIKSSLEKIERENVINNHQTLVLFCEQTQTGDKIIHLHAPLAEKIHKIQTEVDISLGHFSTVLSPGLYRYKSIEIE